MSWYDPLTEFRSKGSQAERPGSLAGLHEARRIHQGQFFTPTEVAAFMWRLVEPAMQNLPHRAAILDNSVGSGRLLWFAAPDQHELYGVDVDADMVAAVGRAAAAAGFICQFEAAGMESCRADGFDVALINPPFSVHIESPTAEPFHGNSFGKYGPKTSAMSHAYALEQALAAAGIVVALLPSTYADKVLGNQNDTIGGYAGRLVAHIALPKGSFREEGTDVSVSVLVFGDWHGNPVRHFAPATLDEAMPDLGLVLRKRYRTPKLRVVGAEDEGPSITRPVTGDTSVRVVHDGRRIGLRFRCGLTEAKVLNAVYRSRIREDGPPDHRHPKGFHYSGQGVLDVEVHLGQVDALASFESLLVTIRDAGGVPDVDSGLLGYLKRRVQQSARQAMPLRHTVWIPDGTAASSADEVVGVAKRTRVANPKVWGSPVIKEGDSVLFVRNERGGYGYALKDKAYSITSEDLYRDFSVVEGASETGWVVVHEGLGQTWPELAKQYDTRAKALGIDQWLSWNYQYQDLLELAMKPQGALVAWNMGLGKARLAVALITLIGCRHGLIVTEAGLVEEMVRELEGLPVSPDDWQVIREPLQLSSLRRINVISYERLRMPAKPGKRKAVFAVESFLQPGEHRLKADRLKAALKVSPSRWTYGRLLRHRIGVLCADEGDVLANPKSDQSRALLEVSAKRRFVLTGTLTPNYPRDTLPMLALTCGDGTAAQPWGYFRGKLDPNWAKSVAYAERGIDAFRDHFVVAEWVTRQWEDDFTGAKREIPRIANIETYRAMLAPHVKRRIDHEPEVAAHVKIPVPTREVVELEWDDAHLAWYLKIAEEFASWYANARRDDGKKTNLISILARIRAVQFAANYPQHGVAGFGSYAPLTSKQRWVIDELERLASTDVKTICYVENPGQADMYVRLLKNRGIEAVPFHGGIPVRTRITDLNRRFRFGDAPVMVASHGVTAKGLNVFQASVCLMANRSWSATTEEQAIHRVLRPQQKRDVLIKFPHLLGSIDQYQAQLVEWKADAMRAGLDWATPQTDGLQFNHLDTILTRFCEGLASLRQIDRRSLKDVLLGKEVA